MASEEGTSELAEAAFFLAIGLALVLGTVWAGAVFDHRDFVSSRIRYIDPNCSLYEIVFQALWAYITCGMLASENLRRPILFWFPCQLIVRQQL